MATVNRCEYCGASIGSDAQTCPFCGAPNPNYQPQAAPAPVYGGGRPRTIAELQAFCAAKHMPLEKMRFFIGVDYREPRAFGIYRDGADFVVYKNKADGSRAIRYRGPDEAFAVGELYDKLKAEHELRNRSRQQQSRSAPVRSGAGRQFGSLLLRKLILPIVLFFVASMIFGAIRSSLGHRKDGYYRAGEDLFYRYGSSWFLGSTGNDWYAVDDFPYSDYDEYYQGKSYDSGWGIGSFTDSDTWDSLQDDDDWDSDSSWDSDYDSWDSSDTDWDSDW